MCYATGMWWLFPIVVIALPIAVLIVIGCLAWPMRPPTPEERHILDRMHRD